MEDISVGKSENSQGSNRKREMAAAQRLRDANLERRAKFVRVLFIAKTIALVSLAIANFTVVSKLLTDASFSLEMIGW
jgi:hypothetical protein